MRSYSLSDELALDLIQRVFKIRGSYQVQVGVADGV